MLLKYAIQFDSLTSYLALSNILYFEFTYLQANPFKRNGTGFYIFYTLCRVGWGDKKVSGSIRFFNERLVWLASARCAQMFDCKYFLIRENLSGNQTFSKKYFSNQTLRGLRKQIALVS